MSPLIDRFGRDHRYLRISVTDRCNLRCTYCMPEDGLAWTPAAKLLTRDEILRLARVFVEMGVSKIRLTGGEPLLRSDILGIVSDLASVEGVRTVAMTTNGIALEKQATHLREAGLSQLTISLDSLKRDKFRQIAKRDRLLDVLAGIDAAFAAGFQLLKINIVVMKDVNDDEVLDFVAWGRDRPVDLRFIEYMPFPDNHWSTGGLVPYREIKDMIATLYELTPIVGDASAVGKSFALGHYGARVSFVTSMTESFCGTCDRLRLTADGNIKACLFHDAERSLRDIIREGGSDADVQATIMAALSDKPVAHAALDDLQAGNNRPMIAIGG